MLRTAVTHYTSNQSHLMDFRIPLTTPLCQIRAESNNQCWCGISQVWGKGNPHKKDVKEAIDPPHGSTKGADPGSGGKTSWEPHDGGSSSSCVRQHGLGECFCG